MTALRKGVDIKLGNNPGSNPAARRVTEIQS
jgi:hypothetical protein